jgi:hypothetical protein
MALNRPRVFLKRFDVPSRNGRDRHLLGLWYAGSVELLLAKQGRRDNQLYSEYSTKQVH